MLFDLEHTIEDFFDTSVNIYSGQVNRAQYLHNAQNEHMMQAGINRTQITEPYLKNGNVIQAAFNSMRKPIDQIERTFQESVQKFRLELETRNEAIRWWAIKKELNAGKDDCSQNSL